MLNGKIINLELLEKKDINQLQELYNNRESSGEYIPIFQVNLPNLEKHMGKLVH